MGYSLPVATANGKVAGTSRGGAMVGRGRSRGWSTRSPSWALARREGRLPLEEVLPGSAVEVALYWHHWEREPVVAQRLTLGVREAARGLGG